MTDAIRALRDRERLLLQAYIHFAALETERSGRPTPMCWPTDTEVATYLGRSASTIRRSRHALATMPAPFIALRYVPPFGRLPDGSTSEHGRNVVMLLAVGAPNEEPAIRELAEATTVMRQLELDLVKAKERVAVLEETVARVQHAQWAANDAPDATSAPSTHNAPQMNTPGWSPRKGRVIERGGESREVA
jgi:hypothetical protein